MGSWYLRTKGRGILVKVAIGLCLLVVAGSVGSHREAATPGTATASPTPTAIASVPPDHGGADVTGALSAPPEPGPLARLLLSPQYQDHGQPSPLVVDIGQVVQMAVIGVDESGNQIEDLAIDWQDETPAGTVDQNGRFTAGTRAGTFQQGVTVTGAQSLAHGLRAVERKATAVITVRPGPLASLKLSPIQIELEPLEKAQFVVEGADAYANKIEDVVLAWRVASNVGSVSPTGSFTAGTKTGVYSGALTLAAQHEGVSRQASASVTVIPGPVASAKIVPSAVSLYTGDPVSLAVSAADRFGNPVTPASIQWSTTAGNIGDGPAGTNFQAGREPGTASLAAQVSDGRATVGVVSSLQINQGYCQTRSVATTWDFRWYSYASRNKGGLVAVSTQPGNFKFDWGFGPVASGRKDATILEATAKIVVRREGPVVFTVAGDDGFRLRINGEEIIGVWSDHSERTARRVVDLPPGIYHLELEYYEWTGVASLSFQTDPDVLTWVEAVSCLGGYTEPPKDRYFVFSTSGETPDQLASRFNVPSEATKYLGQALQGQAVIPGAGARRPPRKAVFLGGINSNSMCANRNPSQDSMFTRLHTLTRAIQLRGFEENGRLSNLDGADIIGFSYSDRYQDCGKAGRYTGANFPADVTTYLGPFGVPERSEILPVYNASDTCAGVSAAAVKLDRLLRRILALEPDASIVLVGHSMGGMVATFYLSQPLSASVSNSIDAVVTIDSPLKGTSLAPPFSNCLTGDTAWKDIRGETPVVNAISSLRVSTSLSKLFAINATVAGHKVPGSNAWHAPCAPKEGGLILGGLVALFNPWFAIPAYFLGEGLDIVAGHSCALYDAQALSKIAKIANEEPVTGFVRVDARIDRLDGVPTTVIAGSTGTISIELTNTGNVKSTFGVTASTRRQNGTITPVNSSAGGTRRGFEYIPPQMAMVTLPPGGSGTASLLATWGEPGPRDIRFRVWEGSTLIADSGWMIELVNVLPKVAG